MHQLGNFAGLFAQALDSQTISTTGLINSLVPLVGLVGVCIMLRAYGPWCGRSRPKLLGLARGQTPAADGQTDRGPSRILSVVGARVHDRCRRDQNPGHARSATGGRAGGHGDQPGGRGPLPTREKGKFAGSAGEPETAARLAAPVDMPWLGRQLAKVPKRGETRPSIRQPPRRRPCLGRTTDRDELFGGFVSADRARTTMARVRAGQYS